MLNSLNFSIRGKNSLRAHHTVSSTVADLATENPVTHGDDMTGTWHTGGAHPLRLPRKPARKPQQRRAVKLPTASAADDALRRARKADPERQRLEHELGEGLRQLEAGKP